MAPPSRARKNGSLARKAGPYCARWMEATEGMQYLAEQVAYETVSQKQHQNDHFTCSEKLGESLVLVSYLLHLSSNDLRAKTLADHRGIKGDS